MRDPKSILSKIESPSIFLMMPSLVQPNMMKPTVKAEMMVPTNAKRVMVLKFRKNRFFSKWYPASNIIGGKRTKK